MSGSSLEGRNRVGSGQWAVGRSQGTGAGNVETHADAGFGRRAWACTFPSQVVRLNALSTAWGCTRSRGVGLAAKCAKREPNRGVRPQKSVAFNAVRSGPCEERGFGMEKGLRRVWLMDLCRQHQEMVVMCVVVKGGEAREKVRTGGGLVLVENRDWGWLRSARHAAIFGWQNKGTA